VIDQADKLRQRVGGERGSFGGEEFPSKIKGMHGSTYWRLKVRYDELQKALGPWA